MELERRGQQEDPEDLESEEEKKLRGKTRKSRKKLSRSRGAGTVNNIAGTRNLLKKSS